jgi:hypothetical protein
MPLNPFEPIFVTQGNMRFHRVVRCLIQCSTTHTCTPCAHTCTHTQGDGAECAAMWCEGCLSRLSRIRRSVVGVKSHVLLAVWLRCNVVSSVVTVDLWMHNRSPTALSAVSLGSFCRKRETKSDEEST